MIKDLPNRHQSMWRIVYVKPDRLHVLQISGNDIDEWITIGETSWRSGSFCYVFATNKLVHLETTHQIMIIQHLDPIIFHVVAQASKIRCTKGTKTFQLDGPFSNLMNVPKLVKNSGHLN